EKKAPSEQAQALDAAPQGEEPSALPPLAPLTSSRRLDAVGVLVLGALPDEAAARVGNGIRAAVKLAPGVKEVSGLDAPHPCADKACWVTAGVARSVHHVLRVKEGARESVRPLPVLVEEAPAVTIAAPKVAFTTPPPAPVVPIAPLVAPVTPPPAPQAAAVETAPLPPAPSRKWTRTAGY